MGAAELQAECSSGLNFGRAAAAASSSSGCESTFDSMRPLNPLLKLGAEAVIVEYFINVNDPNQQLRCAGVFVPIVDSLTTVDSFYLASPTVVPQSSPCKVTINYGFINLLWEWEAGFSNTGSQSVYFFHRLSGRGTVPIEKPLLVPGIEPVLLLRYQRAGGDKLLPGQILIVPLVIWLGFTMERKDTTPDNCSSLHH
jgi:hypothetical protein